MSNIYNNAMCQQPIVQQLFAANWNGQNIADAVKILSVLEPFDRSSYCEDGCKAIKKLYNSIVLKVHPDKAPCSNLCETEGNKMANRAFIMATDAKETLCGEVAVRQLCNSDSRKDDIFTNLKKNRSNSPFVVTEELAKKFGIDLKTVGIDTWLKDKDKEPIDIANFDGEDDAPLKLTYEQAFQFVVDKIENTPANMPCVFTSNHYREFTIFAALTNIEHKNPPRGIDLGSKGYASWYDMICHTLEAAGYIRKCERLQGNYVISR